MKYLRILVMMLVASLFFSCDKDLEQYYIYTHTIKNLSDASVNVDGVATKISSYMTSQRMLDTEDIDNDGWFNAQKKNDEEARSIFFARCSNFKEAVLEDLLRSAGYSNISYEITYECKRLDVANSNNEVVVASKVFKISL